MPTKQATAILSPFDAFNERKKIDAKIAELKKQSDSLKKIIESAFRENQHTLKHPNYAKNGLALHRERKIVGPFTNNGYSYWVYSIDG